MHTYQIHFGSLMWVRISEQEPTTGFQKTAAHLNVMMCKIMEQKFQAVQCLYLRVHSELHQLSNKSHNFYLGLNINLILIFHGIKKRLLLVTYSAWVTNCIFCFHCWNCTLITKRKSMSLSNSTNCKVSGQVATLGYCVNGLNLWFLTSGNE